MAEVPAAVVAAAEAEFPGIRFTEAELETRGDAEVYELEGIFEDKEIEIKLTPEGEVLSTREED